MYQRGEEYFAGHFEGHFVRSLAWRHWSRATPFKKTNVPSWSWASTPAGTSLDFNTHTSSALFVAIIEVLQVVCVPSTLDPTGRVLSGRLLVVSSMHRCMLIKSSLTRQDEPMTLFQGNSELIGSLRPDFDYLSRGSPVSLGMSLWLLDLCRAESSSAEDPTNKHTISALLLLQIDAVAQIYRRVGIFEQRGADRHITGRIKVKKSTITII